MMLSYSSTSLTWVSGQVATASFNAPTIAKEQQSIVFTQMVLAGATTPSGTLTLQCSADGTNWSTLSVNGTAQTIAVSANGTFNFNIPTLASKFFRVAWTFTSGTAGTFTFAYNMN